jgi:hypothetical protein
MAKILDIFAIFFIYLENGFHGIAGKRPALCDISIGIWRR